MADEEGVMGLVLWLRESLRLREAELRARAGQFRAAYRLEPMRSLSVRLADTYDRAADVFAVEIAAQIAEEALRGG